MHYMLIDSEVTISQIKQDRKMRFVFIDSNNFIETRKGYKYYTFYRIVNRENKLSPDAIYKLKEIEWRLPYKQLAFTVTMISLMAYALINR